VGQESSAADALSGSSCRHCALQETCSTEAGGEGPFSGVALVVAAVGYFCAPLVTALGGALVFDQSPLLQLVGGVGGLGVGMLVAVRVARRVRIGPKKGAGA